MTRFFLAALITAFPALALPALAEEDDETHLFEIAGMEVLHPWAPASHGDEAFVYMELHNEGDTAVTLLSARTADGVEGHLVGFKLKNGEMGFEDLPALPVAPGTKLDMEPDVLGFHFDGLPDPLEEGAHWDVILVTSAGDLEIEVAIEGEGARQHSHAGHNH